MKIAIDVSPLESGHKIRGVGFYLTYLKRSLLEYFPEHQYIFFSKGESIDKSVDIVHYPYFDPFFLTLPFHKSQKQVVTVHDVTPLIFPDHFPAGIKGSLRWYIQKFNVQRTDAVIADSHTSEKDIVKITGINEKKVNVVYLAAAEEFGIIQNSEFRIQNLKKKYNLPEKFVLYVGDVTWNKNVPNLIRAIKEINVPLVMIGKALVDDNFDKQNPWNKDHVEILKLIENDKLFIRLGFVPTEDVVQLYNIATVFVFPSLYEGFGLPVIEAMQCGAPVVTTHAGSLKEVAEDAAYIVDPSAVGSIAKGIEAVFNSEKLQKEFSQKGMEQAKKFTWKKTAEDTIAVYEKILLNC